MNPNHALLSRIHAELIDGIATVQLRTCVHHESNAVCA